MQIVQIAIRCRWPVGQLAWRGRQSPTRMAACQNDAMETL